MWKNQKIYFFGWASFFLSIITFQPDSFLFQFHRTLKKNSKRSCNRESVHRVTLCWNGMPWNSILKTTLLEQQQKSCVEWSRREEKKLCSLAEACLSRFRNEVKWKNNRVTVCVYVRSVQGAPKAFTTLFSSPRYIKKKSFLFNSPFLPSKISFSD